MGEDVGITVSPTHMHTREFCVLHAGVPPDDSTHVVVDAALAVKIGEFVEKEFVVGEGAHVKELVVPPATEPVQN